jgi:hypothetical protein
MRSGCEASESNPREQVAIEQLIAVAIIIGFVTVGSLAHLESPAKGADDRGSPLRPGRC